MSRDAHAHLPFDAASGDAQSVQSVQRFVRSVPSLEILLSVRVCCEREAALRAEIRRALGVLSETLLDAAQAEASRTRAAIFRAASMVAARLAASPAPAAAARTTGRDH